MSARQELIKEVVRHQVQPIEPAEQLPEVQLPIRGAVVLQQEVTPVTPIGEQLPGVHLLIVTEVAAQLRGAVTLAEVAEALPAAVAHHPEVATRIVVVAVEAAEADK